MNRIKCLRIVILVTALILLLSGCFVKTVDELYALPTHSDEYYDLQNALDAVFASGAYGYSAPVSGVNQQSVQLADLDGDGEDEAIAYLKTAGERPLNAFVFDLIDGSYVNVAVIEGSGAAFSSVDYAQLDGEPGLELLIGRRLSDQVLHVMSAYTMKDGYLVELMSANYTEYTLADLDSDGKTDLFLLRFDPEGRAGVAELYRSQNGLMAREAEAPLSAGVESIKRILPGGLREGVPAVFVASAYQSSSIITDVFAFRDGTFQNVSRGEAGVSAQTVRSYFVYATDVDGDGLIELPQPVTLPAESAAGETFSLIRWYNLGLDGTPVVKQTTYHDFAGGWYLTIPDQWQPSLTISRSAEVSGVRGYVFSLTDEAGLTVTPVFTIYAFTGEGRMEKATAGGRFLLAEKGDVTFSAALADSQAAQAMAQSDVEQLFHFIHIDWNTGER